MRMIFFVLALILALVIAVVAIVNTEIVTLNYLIDQSSLALSIVILGSAGAGVLVMIFFGIFRSIQKYMGSQAERGLKNELQQKIKTLENEKKKLEDELNRHLKEREEAAAKAHTELEADKKKLEDELKRQQKESEEAAAKAHAELEAEKKRLEEESIKQQKEHEEIS
jgi:lipopolysaccharide assembly protein A